MPGDRPPLWAGNEQSPTGPTAPTAAAEHRARSRRRQGPRPALGRPRRPHGGGDGAVVANLYYAQPLLHEIARTFAVGPAAAAAVITCTQVGYAAARARGAAGRPAPTAAAGGDASPAWPPCPLCLRAGPDLWLFALGSVAVGCRLGGRPGHDPLRGRSGPGRAPGPGGGPDHDRAARWDPAGPDRLGPGGPGGRVARDLLDLGGRSWSFSPRRRALPGGSRPHRSYRHLVGSSLRLLVTSRASAGGPGTGPAPSPPSACCGRRSPSCSRGARTHYSNAVIGLFGLVGRRRHSGGKPGRQTGRLRPGHAHHDRLRVGAHPAPTRCSGPGTPHSATLIAGIVVLDIGTQGMQITNQAVIRCAPTHAAG